MARNNSLPKTERLHSKKLIEKLFNKRGNRSLSEFPLRIVYMELDPSVPSQMLVSVPKRLLHRANKRNRVKRQVREAYRKNKGIIAGLNIAVAFIWLDNKLYPSDVVQQRIVNLLTKVSENKDEEG